MLSLKTAIWFPKLVYDKSVIFKSWSGNGKTRETKLYRLDWSYLDKHVIDYFEQWRQTNNQNCEFIDALDSKYDKWLKSMRFAIPAHYLAEIRRNAQQGLIEWGLERRFDTCVREHCLKPAESHINIAFYLINDCIYDEDTNYFYRRPDRVVLHSAMLLKFWAEQTGSWVALEKANIFTLEERLKKANGKGYNKEEKEEVERYLTMVNAINDKKDEWRSRQCVSEKKDRPATKE